MGNTERRLMWVFLFVIVVLAVLCVGTGCQTLAGAGRDLTAASEGMARAAAER